MIYESVYSILRLGLQYTRCLSAVKDRQKRANNTDG